MSGAAQWERLEGAWEEGLKRCKRKQRAAFRPLLTQCRAALTPAHGPVFSDALRLIDRMVRLSLCLVRVER